jgi:selenocysteine lyase/cysteine desulfurase
MTTTLDAPAPDMAALARLARVVGRDEAVPLADGRRRRYVNCDNAASTPALQPVAEAVDRFLRWYSNVHRGTGFKSRLSSWAFEEARDIVARFVGADPATNVVIFTRNATEGLNRLAHRYPFREGGVVLTSVMEHHSNELPWRRVAEVVHVAVTGDGHLDAQDLEARLAEHRGRVQLVALTGASNVTGYVNPVHTFARMAHAAGAEIAVDAAQLAPHRPVDMRPDGHPEHLDYVVLSGHKMYAPYGVGALIGPRRVFLEGDPDLVGGGTVDIVTLEDAYWTDLPDKEEAGTPDIVGAVAVAKAIRVMEEIGWDAIIAHERALTARALERLARIPGVTVYGGTDLTAGGDRLGTIAFNVEGLPHALVAAILAYEHGVGVRNGCFCAHPYVKALLHVTQEDANAMEERIRHRDRSDIPGAVRMSFGIYNTEEDVDLACEAVATIAAGTRRKDYRLDLERGSYTLPGADEAFERYFSFDAA